MSGWIRMGIGAGLALAALSAGGAAAQEAPDLSDLSVEELANLDVVYAASRHLQSQREAPSFVTVVTAAEIRRFGHRTLADVLRSLPSFHVTDDHNYSYVGARGFAVPGDYNTRILLLVDGVRFNDSIYDQAFVGRTFPVDLSLVDRVEVVRGPGAAVYGNNAFFAVVNVVTRRGQHLDGGEVSLGGGNHGTGGLRAAYGSRKGALDYIVSGTFWKSAGDDLFFPEFADEPSGGHARGLDGERAATAFAALRYRGFALQLAHGDRAKDVPTASYESVFGDPRNRTVDRSTRVTLQYEREAQGLDFVARIHHGRYDYDGTYVFDAAAPFRDGSDGRWWAAEWHGTTRRMGAHLFTFGAEAQWNAHQEQWYTDGVSDIIATDNPSWRWGAFVQDDLRLGARVSASAGLRYDEHDGFAGRISPRASLVLKPTDRFTVKALYGAAFRAPNEYEQHYYTAQLPGLAPETIRTFELVLERAFGNDLRLTAAGFHSDMEGLVRLQPAENGNLFFWNAGHSHAEGVEVAAEARRARDLRLRASYTFQLATDRDTGEWMPNSPRHAAKLSAALPLGRRVEAGLGLRYLGERRTLHGGRSDAVFLADLSVRAPAVWRRLDLGATVTNVFGSAWADPGSEEHRQHLLPQDGRRIDVHATWRF